MIDKATNGNGKSKVRTRETHPQWFDKGCKAGPGRPKNSKSIPDTLRKILKEEHVDKLTGQVGTKHFAIMNRVVNEALEGDKWAVEFIANRTEGKSIETVRNILEDFRDDTETEE